MKFSLSTKVKFSGVKFSEGVALSMKVKFSEGLKVKLSDGVVLSIRVKFKVKFSEGVTLSKVKLKVKLSELLKVKFSGGVVFLTKASDEVRSYSKVGCDPRSGLRCAALRATADHRHLAVSLARPYNSCFSTWQTQLYYST